MVNKKVNADGSTTYFFQNKNGDSQMEVYHIFPGIKLVYHAVHTDRSFLGSAKKGNLIEIHHCREGRVERQQNANYFYLMPGDLSVQIVERHSTEYYFPLNHYHGITISVNVDVAPRCFSCFLKDVNIQPAKIAEKLCADRDCFVVRSSEYIEHIFSELYDVPCRNKVGYFKVKILELLFVLSGMEPEENKISTHTVSSAQVELAKLVATYLYENKDRRTTIQDLCEEFHVSATHLQNVFKGVYGVPVYAYLRIQKMQAAALELVHTNRSVGEIASEWGYDNASKFASAFREIMGETPAQYRKTHGKPNSVN